MNAIYIYIYITKLQLLIISDKKENKGALGENSSLIIVFFI